MFNLGLIAFGTTSGSVLLFSVQKGELHTELNLGHSDKVDCICWNSSGQDLYSCSDDHHIVQWSVEQSKHKRKWKDASGKIYSIAMCHDEKYLLSAGHAIKLCPHNGD